MSYTNKDLFFLNTEQKAIIEAAKSKIKSLVPDKLFKHLVGTLEFSEKLAMTQLAAGIKKYPVHEGGKTNLNELFYKLCLASILHDYGKIFSYPELQKMAKEQRLGLSKFEMGCRSIIHSFVTPFLLERDFNIKDGIILDAVRSHTTGSTSMNIMDRILYIADKVEPSRDYIDSIKLQKLSLGDVDLGLREVYKSNIIYVINNNNTLHPETSNIWNYICGGYKNAIR